MDINELTGYTSAEESFSILEDIGNSVNYDRVRRGEPSAVSAYLKELQPTMEKAVKSFAGGDTAYMTKARMIALEAVESFDESKGADIKTHVFNHLKRLQRVSAQRGNLTRMPENASLQLNVIKRAIREYEADNGIEPTTEQLADITGFSRKRIDALTNMKPVVNDSLAVSPEGDSMGAYNREASIDIYNNMIYDELDDIDKRIYEWSTGYGKGIKLSNKEIAAKLNITPAAVSKRTAGIAAKFAEGRELVGEFA